MGNLAKVRVKDGIAALLGSLTSDGIVGVQMDGRCTQWENVYPQPEKLAEEAVNCMRESCSPFITRSQGTCLDRCLRDGSVDKACSTLVLLRIQY
jgi:hypothetical protein